MTISKRRCSMFRGAWARGGSRTCRLRERPPHRPVPRASWWSASPAGWNRTAPRLRNPSLDAAHRRHGRPGGGGAAVRPGPMAPGSRGSAAAGALFARLPGPSSAAADRRLWAQPGGQCDGQVRAAAWPVGTGRLAGRLYRRAGIFKGIPARGYLLAHDARVQGYICSAVRILLRLSAESANLQGHPESLR